jgi:protoporphyrinogen oxidase
MRRVAVIGAGVAGLCYAERLLSSGGCSVEVVEREDAPGGLARTFKTEGFLFDVGPHRFHTSDAAVQSYVLDVLGKNVSCIPRASSVYLAGRYMTWPLSLEGVLRLPPHILLPSAFELLARRRTSSSSFADDVISKYGRNLYRHFFRDYTAKFTGLPPESLHVDWASAGIDRAVIDKRVKADNLMALLRGLLLPRPVSTSFIYPSEGGIASFASCLARRIESMGGRILLGRSATGAIVEDGRCRGASLDDGSAIESDEVAWSAPVSILDPAAGLEYMSTVLYLVGLRNRLHNNYQWCYFGSRAICFSRLTVPRHFSESMVPPGADSLIVEVSCREGDDLWNDPASLVPRVIEDLERVSAASPGDVLFVRPVRIRNTYPIYSLDYRERLAGIVPPAGLRLLGRCGTFWYNNMDHSIAQALAQAGGGDVPRDFWTDGRA